MPITRKLRTFARLPVGDKLAVGHAALVAGAVGVGLRTMPLHRVARLAGVPLMTEPEQGDRTPARVPEQRTVALVMRNWPFGDTCLRRSLVLGHLLRARQPVLRIGVRRDGAAVEAHAWIVLGDQAIGAGEPDLVALAHARG